MAAHVTGVYLHVVADVISNVRADFLSEGIDEAVLQELQSLWELNMMQTGAIQATAADLSYARGGGEGHTSITPVHDLNMPYEGETPTAELLFPPTPVHTPLPTFNTPGPSSSASEHNQTGIIGDIAIGRPAAFMSPTWMNLQLGTTLGMNPRLDMNIAYDGAEEEGIPSSQYPVTKEFLPPSVGKRKREDTPTSYLPGNYFPQHDGTGDVLMRPFAMSQTSCGLNDSRARATRSVLSKGLHQYEQSEERIPQLDGIGDDNDDLKEEDPDRPAEVIYDEHKLLTAAKESNLHRPTEMHVNQLQRLSWPLANPFWEWDLILLSLETKATTLLTHRNLLQACHHLVPEC